MAWAVRHCQSVDGAVTSRGSSLSAPPKVTRTPPAAAACRASSALLVAQLRLTLHRQRMAVQTVILELPEAVYQWAQRTARTTERAVESVLVDALNTTLPPPLDQVLIEWREELEAVDTLSTSVLL
jgi:hypothetical protein